MTGALLTFLSLIVLLPLCQVWSSVDQVQGDGSRTLCTNWVKNGPGTVTIAFSPRAAFGLQVAQAYNNPSTVYAYLMGGSTLLSTSQGMNDVYYTVGKGVTACKATCYPFTRPAVTMVASRLMQLMLWLCSCCSTLKGSS